MGVTSAPARISEERVLTVEVTRERHLTAYSCAAFSTGRQPNCLIIPIPGDHMSLVSGPEKTEGFMVDISRPLPNLTTPHLYGIRPLDLTPKVYADVIGHDFWVAIAERPEAMLAALDALPAGCRPELYIPSLVNIAEWCRREYRHYSMVMVTWRGDLRPKHPIMVSYEPFYPDVLFAPGASGNGQELPELDQSRKRDCSVAFGVTNRRLPLPVRYADPAIGRQQWAPASVTGFRDNRQPGPNRDYWVHTKYLSQTGWPLAERAMSPPI